MWPGDQACLFVQIENFYVNIRLLMQHYIFKKVLHPKGPFQ